MQILIALPILTLVILLAGSLTIFGARSFLAMTNYLEMENDSRVALDRLSRDIRQAQNLVTFEPQHLVFQDYDDGQLEFTYSPSTRTLTRLKGNEKSVLLKGCNYLEFTMFQRTPIFGTYEFHPTASATTCKMVQIRWLCSRSVPGGVGNTECIQNARIVIRKKKFG